MRKYVMIQVRMIAEDIDPKILKNLIRGSLFDYFAPALEPGEIDIKVEYLPFPLMVNEHGYAVPFPPL